MRKLSILFVIVQACISGVWSQCAAPPQSQSSSSGGPPPGICILPPELGYTGKETNLLECKHLHYFGTITDSPPSHTPFLEGSGFLGNGIQKVCCPNNADILLPTSPCYAETKKKSCEKCPDSCGETYDDYYDDYYGDFPLEYPACQEGSTCSPSSECGADDFSLDNTMRPCGIPGEGTYCCTGAGAKLQEKVQAPQFPTTNDAARPCEDHTELCKQWEKKFPESCQPGHSSYEFMSLVCMESCGRCGSNGCVDHYEQCGQWSRDGKCVKYPEFMIYNCRESCGTCGFKSPMNKEEQRNGEGQFTNPEGGDFVCGKGKKKTEEELNQSPTMHVGADCSGVFISDRFLLTAAHCVKEQEKGVQVVTIRDSTQHQETIAISRTYVHYNYIEGSFYNDIALLELERRIIFDYKTYGDSPPCLSKVNDVADKEATLQGVGEDENGESGILLEAKVMTMSPDECKEWADYNATTSPDFKSSFQQHLPKGLTPDILCTHGKCIEEGADGHCEYTDACRGDDGGPLYIDEVSGENGYSGRTLAGLFTGSTGSCGKSLEPQFWNCIATHRPWIFCTMKFRHLNEVDLWRKCLRDTGAFKDRGHPCCNEDGFENVGACLG